MTRRFLVAVVLLAVVAALGMVPTGALAGASGQLYAFGDNFNGQLGNATNNGNAKPNPTPALVSLPGATGPVVQVAVGVAHSLAVTSAGQLYAFGSNDYGELGNATNNGTSKPNPTPAPVSLPGATGHVVQVAGGGEFSLAVTSTGQLYAFGVNNIGQLGNATNSGTAKPNPTPALVSLPGATGPVVQVAAGEEHSLAVTSTGQLYAFGDNFYGQLGSPDNGTADPPALVSLPGATGPVVQVAAGNEHTLVVTSTGQLYAFGENNAGQLGTTTNSGTFNPNSTPALVSLPGATGPVVQVAAGDSHSLAVTSTGQLYAFGANHWGELGSTTNNDTDNPNPTPALVSLPGATGPVVQVAAGDNHSLAVTSTGQLYAFGENSYGELGSTTNSGTGTPNPKPALVGVPDGASIDTVARGSEADHALVVLADIAVATNALPGGTVGVPYTAQLQASGGAPPYRWSVSGLPGGLSLDSSTGAISGTPAQAGSFTVTAAVRDQDGIVASRTLALSITPITPVLSSLNVSPRKLSLAGRRVHDRCKPLSRSNHHDRRCRMKLKLSVRFTLSAAGSLTITFVRMSPGRRVHGNCAKPRHANRKHRRCTRQTPLPGMIGQGAGQGQDTIAITHAALPPGTYQIVITPQASGKSGTPQTATITITG